jgi:hypothetical protein
MKIINLIAISLISSLFLGLINFPRQATAQETNSTEEIEALKTINEVINEAFFRHSHDINRVSTIGGFLNDFFGATQFIEGSYPENQIRRDAKLFQIIHRDLWRQQTESNPLIRTQDLRNPYCTSVQTGVDRTCD